MNRVNDQEKVEREELNEKVSVLDGEVGATDLRADETSVLWEPLCFGLSHYIGI